MSIKVFSIFGTRPEAIKMAPVIKILEKDTRFESKVAVTAQHREMLDPVLKIFKIYPDFDLNIMEKNQTLTYVTTKILTELESILQAEKPDLILVHGDTTTTFSAAVAGFYQRIPIGHIEAGLRTWNKYSPFPEEVNRKMTDVLADIYFAPTLKSRSNLLKENKLDNSIYVTGNTIIDAMKYTVLKNYKHPELSHEKFIIVTMHRRENLGKPMINVFTALNKVAQKFSKIKIVFPIHKNPSIRDLAKRYLFHLPNVSLIEPLDVVDFHNFLARSYLVLSDSGGLQEEATSLGIPTLVLRNTTERPEGIEAGSLKLIGTDSKIVFKETEALLTNKQLYEKMSQSKNPYGDGFASERILEAIFNFFRLNRKKN